MIKIVAGFFVVMIMISAGTVYSLKETAQRLEIRKKQLSARILEDRSAIKVLRAEMAYLSQPERLQKLSRRFLALSPAQSGQMALSITSISVRADMRLTSLPVDEFPLLLPRRKPVFQAQRYNGKQVSVSQASAVHKKRPDIHQKRKAGFYERISLKIEGAE